jgi:hypothetical protein
MAHTDKTPKNEWFIDEMWIIYSKEPDRIYNFKLEKWIERNEKMNAYILPLGINELNIIASPCLIYYITVITGKQKLAGTDARIFIELSGTNGLSGIHRLHNHHAKEFQRGQTNHFHVIV